MTQETVGGDTFVTLDESATYRLSAEPLAKGRDQVVTIARTRSGFRWAWTPDRLRQTEAPHDCGTSHVDPPRAVLVAAMRLWLETYGGEA